MTPEKNRREAGFSSPFSETCFTDVTRAWILFPFFSYTSTSDDSINELLFRLHWFCYYFSLPFVVFTQLNVRVSWLFKICCLSFTWRARVNMCNKATSQWYHRERFLTADDDLFLFLLVKMLVERWEEPTTRNYSNANSFYGAFTQNTVNYRKITPTVANPYRASRERRKNMRMR